MNITTKEVKTLNATSGYIQMPKSEVGKEFLVMTKEDLGFILRGGIEKLNTFEMKVPGTDETIIIPLSPEEDKDFEEAMENRKD